MKTTIFFAFVFFSLITGTLNGQSQQEPIGTLLGSKKIRSSGAYGAITNKFTNFNGQYANMVEMYGGWYINHKLMIGAGFAAVTNDIPVPAAFSAIPGTALSYEYGQVGLMTEYVIGSEKAIHVAFQLFSGAGFTVQYQRHGVEENDWEHEYNQAHDEDWFFVAEPGVKLEMNILPWMRFSPGVSYRAAFNSSAKGLSDSAISGTSYNLTLKFGKF
jgi:hypothetical protein